MPPPPPFPTHSREQPHPPCTPTPAHARPRRPFAPTRRARADLLAAREHQPIGAGPDDVARHALHGPLQHFDDPRLRPDGEGRVAGEGGRPVEGLVAAVDAEALRDRQHELALAHGVRGAPGEGDDVGVPPRGAGQGLALLLQALAAGDVVRDGCSRGGRGGGGWGAGGAVIKEKNSECPIRPTMVAGV